MNSFKILSMSSGSKGSKARRGVLKTAHGTVQTPAFVTVGTKATVKSMKPEDLELTGTQFLFVNTYHIVLHPGVDVVLAAGGVHKFSHLNKPIITDSGGFQVFSLGKHQQAVDAQVREVNDWDGRQHPTKIKIMEDGVSFQSHTDGQTYMFTPEFSIDAQKKIGGDCIVAFDEDILNKASESYTRESTERTHRWLARCVEELARPVEYKLPLKDQTLYGVIHGGRFEKLRKWSAETIAGAKVGGIALGGVSVGLEGNEIKNEVAWVSETLGSDPRPRHLLGIGTFAEIILGVRHGFDTFDCVLPTRLARIGKLYDGDVIAAMTLEEIETHTDKLFFNITQKSMKTDYSPINAACQCYTCHHYSKAYLYHLYRQRELLGYHLGTIHNLHVMETFFARLRKDVEDGML